MNFWWIRDVHASGSTASKAFQGPGTVTVSISLPVQGIQDHRFVVLYQRDDGETVALPQIIQHDESTMSGFYFRLRREALGPVALEITVERTGEGEEPPHVLEWYMLRGPDPPKEPGRGGTT